MRGEPTPYRARRGSRAVPTERFLGPRRTVPGDEPGHRYRPIPSPHPPTGSSPQGRVPRQNGSEILVDDAFDVALGQGGDGQGGVDASGVSWDEGSVDDVEAGIMPYATDVVGGAVEGHSAEWVGGC